MQSPAGLIVDIDLRVNCMPKQRPAVTAITFNICATIKKIAQLRNIFHLDGIMSWTPGHNNAPNLRLRPHGPYLLAVKGNIPHLFEEANPSCAKGGIFQVFTKCIQEAKEGFQRRFVILRQGLHCRGPASR